MTSKIGHNKVNYNLKLSLSYAKLTCFIYFVLNIIEKRMSQPLVIFVFSAENNEIG